MPSSPPCSARLARDAHRFGRRPEGGVSCRGALHHVARQHRVGRDRRRGLEHTRGPRHRGCPGGAWRWPISDRSPSDSPQLYGDGHAAERCVAAIGTLGAVGDEAERRRSGRVGVAGLGYWGPNLARNFATIPGCELTWLCDTADGPRQVEHSPSERTDDGGLQELLDDPELDAVVLATPVPTHAELAIACPARRQALLRGEAIGDDGRRRAARRGRGRAGGPHADGRPPAGVPPCRQSVEGAAGRGRVGRPVLRVRQPAEPRQAARGRERAVEPRRPRRLGRAGADRRGAGRVSGARRPHTCAPASRTWSSATCASPRARSRTCTCRGSTPTRSAA